MSVEEQTPAAVTDAPATPGNSVTSSDVTVSAPPAPEHKGGPAPPMWLTDEQKNLLERRKKLAWAAQHAFYERAGILGKLNYWIGVPVVVVTALAGSAIVANHSSDNPLPTWIGLITVTAAVLASLQTFFRFGERAAFSAVAGNRYGRLRRRIEDCLAAPPEGMAERLEEIRKLEDDAGDQAPPLGERRWLRWQRFAGLPTPAGSNVSWWERTFGRRRGAGRHEG
ncbi:MAG TPA: SLATT domain-containing protein [Actinomycetota bacterium]|nr:SLATT domain-containing protein [Actinomycetota bacterium]